MDFSHFFGKFGLMAANNRIISVTFCVALTIIFGFGALNAKFETDPQNLWVIKIDLNMILII